MRADNISIAILLTVHNRREKTLKCLERLFSVDIRDTIMRVVLCDDNSTDGTGDAVKEFFPEVMLIEGDGNLFWNRGMRRAWEYASKINPDYYLWLNDDTELMNDSIFRLLSCSEHFDDKSIIVGSTCESSQIRTLTYGGRLKTHNNPFVLPDKEKPTKCDTFNGNVVLIPRFVYEKIGYNDKFYRHSFGDFDYGISAGIKGIDCYVAPGYYGYCKRNNPIPRFRRKCYSLIERYKILYSPLGYNPIEDFHLNKKYRPLWLCILYFIKLHINVLFTVDHTKYNQ